jgi:hypothetical protein
MKSSRNWSNERDRSRDEGDSYPRRKKSPKIRHESDDGAWRFGTAQDWLESDPDDQYFEPDYKHQR